MIALTLGATRAAHHRLADLAAGVVDTALGAVGVVTVLGLATATALASGRRR